MLQLNNFDWRHAGGAHSSVILREIESEAQPPSRCAIISQPSAFAMFGRRQEKLRRQKRKIKKPFTLREHRVDVTKPALWSSDNQSYRCDVTAGCTYAGLASPQLAQPDVAGSQLRAFTTGRPAQAPLIAPRAYAACRRVPTNAPEGLRSERE